MDENVRDLSSLKRCPQMSGQFLKFGANDGAKFPFSVGKVKYGKVEDLNIVVKMKEQIHSEVNEKQTGIICNEMLGIQNEEYLIDKAYKEKGSLGKGSFGQVTLCVDNKTQEEFVIKNVKALRSEEVLAPSRLINEKYIVKIFGVMMINKSSSSIFLEYCGDSLHAAISCKAKYDILYQNDFELINQLCLAVFSAHEKNVWHCDIKPPDSLFEATLFSLVEQHRIKRLLPLSVIIADNHHVAKHLFGSCRHEHCLTENLCIKLDPLLLKITDWGSSNIDHPENFYWGGCTTEYAAPELLLKMLQDNEAKESPLTEKFGREPLTGKVDEYAMGLTILYFMHRQSPAYILYQKTNNAKYLREKVCQNLILQYSKQNDVMKSLIDSAWSSTTVQVLDRLLSDHASKRWSVDKILKEFFAAQRRVIGGESTNCIHPTVPRRHFKRKRPYPSRPFASVQVTTSISHPADQQAMDVSHPADQQAMDVSHPADQQVMFGSHLTDSETKNIPFFNKLLS